MSAAPRHEEIAVSLYNGVFFRRNNEEMGSTDEALPKEMLKAFLSVELPAAYGRPIPPETIEVIAREFPLVDLNPDDDPSGQYFDRSVARLARLLEHVLGAL